MLEDRVSKSFKKIAPKVDFCSLRLHRDHMESVQVHQDLLQPLQQFRDLGAMITVHHRGGMGYCSTSDLSEGGLRRAVESARDLAETHARRAIVNFSEIAMPHPKGEFHTNVKYPWNSMPVSEKVERLTGLSKCLKNDPRIVDWHTGLYYKRSEHIYLTSEGGEAYQDFSRIVPMADVTANRGTETAHRSFSRFGSQCRQMGLELLDELKFFDQDCRISEQALELLDAPNCPSGKMDLLLDPGQMMLQIHESIGHPLELDRILGDERNYAGTSFVTLEMLGKYQYGSKLLNITFDPSKTDQVASYKFDDDGEVAKKDHIIKDGILLKALGGVISQHRAGVGGVASTRACSWNRPPIDRMANLNLVSGNSSFDEMVAAVENGIFMETNCSWSIDDSRNKFQFGCERAQLIENGKLTQVVKKPNYRGISANFWRNLKMTGNHESVQFLGTPGCGKGEPNQVVFVGHASPACLFADVDVFGGE